MTLRGVGAFAVSSTLLVCLTSVYALAERYFYDSLNRLVRIERSDGVVVTYTYDALGNRLTKKVVHDRDFDDAADAVDNCPTVYNQNQANTDGDPAGDACDCMSSNPAAYPGAPQMCDGFNNDCSDPSWPTIPANEADADHDSYRICSGDCNDANPSVHPGAPQICDGVNNNCSDPSWPAVPTNEADTDSDGFRICAGDCDDSIATVYPGAPQTCDGINNNCSDASWPDVPANEADADGDNFRICAGDCNDTDPDIFPNAVEINDGKDNQCPSNPGYGISDEISGTMVFSNLADPNEISWPTQPGGTAYEVVRATSPLFPPTCGDQVTQTLSWSDPAIPPMGGAFFYLLRPIAPHIGSWGQSSSGVERVGLCGAESDCTDGMDNDGDAHTDCDDPDCFQSTACTPATFSFVDRPGDDITPTALWDFFASITGAPTDYISFSLSGPDVTDFKWCAERADFYRNSYLAMAVSGGTVTSGSWDKWSLMEGGSWTGPDTAGYENSYSMDCWEGQAWCTEIGLAGHYAVISPEETGECEAVDFSIGCGSGNWLLTIKVGSDRLRTCGF